MEVPYKKQEEYFKFENLAMVIKDRIGSSTNFLMTFLNYFEDDSYKKEEFYQLKNIDRFQVEDKLLYDRVRAFINARCEVGKKHSFSFRRFYEIAMLVAKMDEKNKRIEKELSKRLGSNLDNLSESQRFKLEEWLDRYSKQEKLERQLKLF